MASTVLSSCLVCFAVFDQACFLRPELPLLASLLRGQQKQNLSSISRIRTPLTQKDGGLHGGTEPGL
jgi:hypothetical protein